MYYRLRKEREAGLPNTLTGDEWKDIIASYGGRCAYCRKKCKLTIDHIIPVIRGGATTKQNVVPACRSCNSKKNAGPPPVPVMAVLI